MRLSALFSAVSPPRPLCVSACVLPRVCPLPPCRPPAAPPQRSTVQGSSLSGASHARVPGPRVAEGRCGGQVRGRRSAPATAVSPLPLGALLWLAVENRQTASQRHGTKVVERSGRGEVNGVSPPVTPPLEPGGLSGRPPACASRLPHAPPLALTRPSFFTLPAAACIRNVRRPRRPKSKARCCLTTSCMLF